MMWDFTGIFPIGASYGGEHPMFYDDDSHEPATDFDCWFESVIEDGPPHFSSYLNEVKLITVPVRKLITVPVRVGDMHKICAIVNHDWEKGKARWTCKRCGKRRRGKR